MITRSIAWFPALSIHVPKVEPGHIDSVEREMSRGGFLYVKGTQRSGAGYPGADEFRYLEGCDISMPCIEITTANLHIYRREYEILFW